MKKIKLYSRIKTYFWYKQNRAELNFFWQFVHHLQTHNIPDTDTDTYQLQDQDIKQICTCTKAT